jgi:hypothetical protein
MNQAGGIPEPLRADNQIRKKGTGTLKKERATDLSIIDLRQLFLTELGHTAPEVIENFDQAQDISQWADEWGLNVPWVITVAKWMKESRQGQIDRLDLSTDGCAASFTKGRSLPLKSFDSPNSMAYRFEVFTGLSDAWASSPFEQVERGKAGAVGGCGIPRLKSCNA